MVNLVLLDGEVSHLALRYSEDGKPELRWTLLQRDGEFTSYWPCCSAGPAALRMAEMMDDGDHVLISSGKLCYRKRDGKMGLQSRMEILVWLVEKLQAPLSSEGAVSPEGAVEIVDPEPTSAAPAIKARRPRYPKALKQPWSPN